MRAKYLSLIVFLTLTSLLMTTGIVAALEISKAEYVATITISNNSTTASYVCVPYSLNTTALINNFGVNSSCNNTALINIAGAPTAYMPSTNSTNPWIAYVPSINANTQLNYKLYIGGSANMSGKLVYFPGDAGMTTANSTSLDLGDNFTIEQSGWINTDNATGKNLVYKKEAFRVFVSPTVSEDITSSIFQWTSPTGGSGTSWNPVASAYDDDTASKAGYQIPSNAWSSVLTLTGPPVLSDTVRYWVSVQNAIVNQIDLDVYYNGGVHHVYEGALTSGTWVTKDIGSLEMVTQVRIKLKNSSAEDIYFGYVHEVDFGDWSTVSVTAENVSSGDHKVEVATIADEVIEVDENFEWGVDGDSLDTSGGTVTWAVTAEGTSRAEIDTAQQVSGTRSARLYRDGTNPPATYFTQSAIGDGQAIAFRFRKDADSRLQAYHGNGTYRALIQVSATEDLQYADADGDYQTIDTVLINTWYLLELRDIDWVAGTYDIYLDGARLADDVELNISASHNDVINFMNYAGTSEIWIDDVQVKQDQGLTISIGGVQKDFTYFTGSIPVTADNWTFLQNGVMPYMEYQEITVDGVTKQHIEWEFNDTTFHDTTIYENNATPSFRTASPEYPGVSATVLSLLPFSEAKADISELGDAGQIVTDAPTQPTNLYDPGSTINIPGAAAVNAILGAGHVPLTMFWYPFAFVIIIGAGFLAYKIAPSLLIKAVVIGSAMGFCAVINIFGFWVVIFFIMEAFAVVILSKHYGW